MKLLASIGFSRVRAQFVADARSFSIEVKKLESIERFLVSGSMAVVGTKLPCLLNLSTLNIFIYLFY